MDSRNRNLVNRPGNMNNMHLAPQNTQYSSPFDPTIPAFVPGLVYNQEVNTTATTDNFPANNFHTAHPVTMMNNVGNVGRPTFRPASFNNGSIYTTSATDNFPTNGFYNTQPVAMMNNVSNGGGLPAAPTIAFKQHRARPHISAAMHVPNQAPVQAMIQDPIYPVTMMNNRGNCGNIGLPAVHSIPLNQQIPHQPMNATIQVPNQAQVQALIQVPSETPVLAATQALSQALVRVPVSTSSKAPIQAPTEPRYMRLQRQSRQRGNLQNGSSSSFDLAVNNKRLVDETLCPKDIVIKANGIFRYLDIPRRNDRFRPENPERIETSALKYLNDLEATARETYLRNCSVEIVVVMKSQVEEDNEMLQRTKMESWLSTSPYGTSAEMTDRAANHRAYDNAVIRALERLPRYFYTCTGKLTVRLKFPSDNAINSLPLRNSFAIGHSCHAVPDSPSSYTSTPNFFLCRLLAYHINGFSNLQDMTIIIVPPSDMRNHMTLPQLNCFLPFYDLDNTKWKARWQADYMNKSEEILGWPKCYLGVEREKLLEELQSRMQFEEQEKQLKAELEGKLWAEEKERRREEERKLEADQEVGRSTKHRSFNPAWWSQAPTPIPPLQTSGQPLPIGTGRPEPQAKDV